MAEDGLLFKEPEPFNELMEHCANIADRANRGEWGNVS